MSRPDLNTEEGRAAYRRELRRVAWPIRWGGLGLIVLAAARPEALYTQGVGAFEFERTVSRFNEMQSQDWLAHVREDG